MEAKVLDRKYYKNRFLRPFLLLLEYRITSGAGERAVFRGDGLPPDRIKGRNIWYLLSDGAVYFFLKKKQEKSSRGKRGKDMILLSDTFLWSDRYCDVLNEVLDRKDTIGMLSYPRCDIYRWTGQAPLDRKRFRAMCLPIGTSVAGWHTKRAVLKVYRAMSGQPGAGPMDKLLRDMEKSIRRDVGRIANVLENKGIKQYITVNEYDLKEYIIMAACKKLGIETKLLMHAALAYLPLPEEKTATISYADRMYFWSRPDLEWSRKYQEHVGIGGKLMYEVCGSPEICRNTFQASLEKYRKEQSITLLLPGMMEDYSDDKFHEVAKMRVQLISKVHSLAEKEHMRMYLRYHPAESKEVIDMEKGLVAKYGISIVGGGAEGLKRLLCRSMCIIAGGTSALILADAYGANCYCVEMDGEAHDFCGHGRIKTVSIDEIGGIDVRAGSGMPDYEYCLDYEKLFGTS